MAGDKRFEYMNTNDKETRRILGFHASKLEEVGTLKKEGFKLAKEDHEKEGYIPKAAKSYSLTDEAKKLYEEILPLKNELLA